MGIAKLCALIECGDDDVAAFVCALVGELRTGNWKSDEAFAAHFPVAAVRSGEACIPISTDYTIEITMNYETGMMLIVSAGIASRVAPGRRATKGEAA